MDLKYMAFHVHNFFYLINSKRADPVFIKNLYLAAKKILTKYIICRIVCLNQYYMAYNIICTYRIQLWFGFSEKDFPKEY